MQIDFHYYATYCAAYMAGYSHDECCDIAYSAQFVDHCSRTLLDKLNAPKSAVTTQLQTELMDTNTDIMGLQNITRIWSSFHFLPQDLYSERKKCSKKYLKKYRLLCGPNGTLLKETVELAKNKNLQSVGIAMHILADTWAHRYFVGTPSFALNNTDYYFFEIFPDGTEKEIKFRHSASQPDDLENSIYSNSIFRASENSIMNLGHGRAGHLPDYSFCTYKYLPAWGDYREIIKDNPHDYWCAYRQMIYAMKYLRGSETDFLLDTYDNEAVKGYEEEIDAILRKRQLISSSQWKDFGEKLSGWNIPEYNINTYQKEYLESQKKERANTFLGRFFESAINQKSMVTNRIFNSGNYLAGYSVTPKSTNLIDYTINLIKRLGGQNE